MPSQLKVTKPGHCRMIERLLSHIIVSAMSLIIMSPPSVKAVVSVEAAEAPPPASLIAASVMPRAVARLRVAGGGDHLLLGLPQSSEPVVDLASDRRPLMLQALEGVEIVLEPDR